jgi:hypothetical protein
MEDILTSQWSQRVENFPSGIYKNSNEEPTDQEYSKNLIATQTQFFSASQRILNKQFLTVLISFCLSHSFIISFELVLTAFLG